MAEPRQELETVGDWRAQRPHVAGAGGLGLQYDCQFRSIIPIFDDTRPWFVHGHGSAQQRRGR